MTKEKKSWPKSIGQEADNSRSARFKRMMEDRGYWQFDASEKIEKKNVVPSRLLTNPSESDLDQLLARCLPYGLRGIEDYSGNVYLWPFEEGTHGTVADALGIPYDPSSDYADKLTAKTFYIRSLGDWQNRQQRRSKPGSFTYQCRNQNRDP